MIKAQVTQVLIGPLTIEGLMLPDGTFAISATQANKVVKIAAQPTDAARSLKRLLGKDLTAQPTVLNSQEVKVISLEDFVQVVKLSAKKGNQAAIDFAIAMTGLSLHQLFCDAFGVEMGSKERQQFLLGELKALEQEKDYYLTGMVKANIRASQTRKAAAEKRAMVRAFEGYEKSRGANKAKYREEFYKLAEGKGAVDYRSLDELAPVVVPEVCNF